MGENKQVNDKPVMEEKEIDLGLLTLYRFLIIVFIAIAVIVLYIGWLKGIAFLMYVSTVPFCVSIYYYRRFAAKRDEIAYKLVHTDAYRKKEVNLDK